MSLINAIRKDEKSAPRDYHKLLRQVSRRSDRRVIRRIIRDEKRHLRAINKIKLKRR